MKAETINELARAAAEQAEDIFSKTRDGDPAARCVRLRKMFADWLRHATERERRNDRRRIGRTRA
ncbi:hypothetical protein FV226_13175 [Methylobacterium sp. WL12]|uniref:hypothetical protein n=1 Tax=Methylobacterium sp. WL12 TaxID=2603890 RepID=UPI0011C964D2|nr:hypothetical protein [Methylobacterium sp. WL12]TXM72175.1 hypothetical protein FV226_13175 [Methylobacterium sp. WL12]